MANFQTHINVGVAASSIAASSLLGLGMVSTTDIMLLWVTGIIGSILPDIDADDSTAIRVIFKIVGVTFAIGGVLFFYQQLSLLSIWGLAIILYLSILCIGMPFFQKFTVHRGSLHSLLACLLFGLLTVQLYLLMGKSTIVSWLAGAFVLMGMLVHLILDECYSVELTNISVKRSFGSALKPFALKYPLTTFTHIIICFYLWHISPPIAPMVDAINANKMQLLPNKFW